MTAVRPLLTVLGVLMALLFLVVLAAIAAVAGVWRIWKEVRRVVRRRRVRRELALVPYVPALPPPGFQVVRRAGLDLPAMRSLRTADAGDSDRARVLRFPNTLAADGKYVDELLVDEIHWRATERRP